MWRPALPMTPHEALLDQPIPKDSNDEDQFCSIFFSSADCGHIGDNPFDWHGRRDALPGDDQNCGRELTFHKAPSRAFAGGQNSAEVFYLLGLGDKVVGTGSCGQAISRR